MARSRHVFCCLIAFMLLPLSWTAPAHGADSVLDVVPSTALAWGAANHLDASCEKLQNLAKIVQVPAANLLDTLKKGTGLEKGIDEKGALGFFIVPGKSDKELVAGVIFVAVKDENEFLGNFNVIKTSGKIHEVKFKSPASPGTHLLAMLHGYAILADAPKRTAWPSRQPSKASRASPPR